MYKILLVPLLPFFSVLLVAQTPSSEQTPPASSTPGQVTDDSPLVMKVGKGDKAMEIAIWPKDGLAGRPLLIAGHGNGGSGPKEIQGWIELARKNQFTIVCPTLHSSVHSQFIDEDRPGFGEVLDWIKDHVQHDKENVFMTGFSGGGYGTWYLATEYPRVFKGLFLQSGNFAGENSYGLNLKPWRNKPIRIIWGSQDLPDIIKQNQDIVGVLEKDHFKNVTHEVVQGAGHQAHHDLVSAWILEASLKP